MLDMHSQMILDEYRENLPAYETVNRLVGENLHRLIIDDFGMLVNSIDGRVKTEKSLTGKLELKGYKYKSIKDITDIVGYRVVTFYTDEVDKIAAALGNIFTVDWENSIDKRKTSNIKQFGYMSLHYICSIPEEMYHDENMPFVNEIKFEVQIRSTLQHAWAQIEHDIGYKNDVGIPAQYVRSFSRLSGLLELADEEFKRIRIMVDEYRKKVKSVVASGNFKDAPLDQDSFNAYIEAGAFAELNKKLADLIHLDVEDVPLNMFFKVFRGLRFETLDDVEQMRKEYSDAAFQFSLAQFQGMDIDIITSKVGLTSLCAVYIMAKGYGENGLRQLYNAVNGERKSNERLVKKALEIGKKTGIIKE